MSSPFFSSKAIIGCYVFLTLFKAIIEYCHLSPSKAIIRCRIPPSKAIIRCRVLFFHPKPLLGVMCFSLYSKPLLDIVIFLHLKPLLDVESFFIQSHYWVLRLFHFIQSHY